MYILIKEMPMAYYVLEGLRKGYNYPDFYFSEALDYFEADEKYEICSEICQFKELNKHHRMGKLPAEASV